MKKGVKAELNTDNNGAPLKALPESAEGPDFSFEWGFPFDQTNDQKSNFPEFLSSPQTHHISLNSLILKPK